MKFVSSAHNIFTTEICPVSVSIGRTFIFTSEAFLWALCLVGIFVPKYVTPACRQM